MASELEQVLKDAKGFQEGLNAFESADFSSKCPTTKLIYGEVPNPDDPGNSPPPDDLGGKVGTYITVRDYCTDEPISGAHVVVGHVGYTSNADGKVYVGQKNSGTVLSVAISAAGYTSSGDDTLNNDQITVP